jgi:flagellar hook-basal body complex protein FliE
MTTKPVYAPVPMPKIPSSLPDFRPKVFNQEFYNGSGSGVAALGEVIGAQGVSGDGNFDTVMLKALDKVSAYQQNYDAMIQQAIIDPDSMDVHDIAEAQAKAELSLNITRTILNRVVQAWKDIINTR